MTRSLPSELLERIWFYVNLNCNLCCTYCVAAVPPGMTRPRLELPAFRRLLDEAVSLGFRQVALTGGEPFMHPDIAAMIAYATARIDTVVLTNALVVTPKTLDNLKQADRRRLTVQVSLDSADPGENDALRGRGSWRKARRGLERLLAAGLTVAVRATLDGQGAQALAELTQFLGNLGVPADRVYGAPVAKVGNSRRGLELTRAGLWPEPTLIGDGLYWHPLLIEPSLVIARQTEPLEPALVRLAALVDEIKPIRPKDVR
jgi:MoaA/NifB/PqqE/SkfB family radical SAM enzyme